MNMFVGLVCFLKYNMQTFKRNNSHILQSHLHLSVFSLYIMLLEQIFLKSIASDTFMVWWTTFAYYIQADVLAHCAPKDLQLSSGALSRVLLNDAGPGLQQELSSVARNGIDYGSVVITQGHNLRCKYVFHGSLPKWGTSSPDPLKVCYCYPTFDKWKQC